MPVLDALETGSDLNALWLRGGFPDSFTAGSDGASMRWRGNFIRTYLERDLPQSGLRAPTETLGRFWTMLCHRQGSLFNAAELARNPLSHGVVATPLPELIKQLIARS